MVNYEYSRIRSLSFLTVNVAEEHSAEEQSFDIGSVFAVPSAELENSMVDANDVDINLPAGDPLITFRLIEGGSKRSRDKLVDSLGYSYTIKRRFVFLAKNFDFHGITASFLFQTFQVIYL